MSLTWEKVDAIPGWFAFQAYCTWRALLDRQQTERGDLFEIGVWKGRSAAVLASYRKPEEKLFLCDLRLDEPAVHAAIRSVGVEPANIVPLSGPSAELTGKLDLKSMFQTVRWFHIDGEHTGPAVYRELELAHAVLKPNGIVVIDDFFSPRYPANTTEAIRYVEKNPFHFRLLAVAFNKGYFCRPEALASYMDYLSEDMTLAIRKYGHRATIFKTTGPWDNDAVGIMDYIEEAGPIAGPDHEPQIWHMIRTRPVWSPVWHLRNASRFIKSKFGL
jgi:SAM-dependent methyltransferase